MNPLPKGWRKAHRNWSALVAGVAGQSPYRAWTCVFIGLAMLSRAAGDLGFGDPRGDSGERMGAVAPLRADPPGVGLALGGIALLTLVVGGQALLRWRRGAFVEQGSKGFWLYCASLSSIFVAIGIGYLRHGTVLQGGRFGPVSSAQGHPSSGVFFIVIGMITVGLCLRSAFRSQRG